MCSNRWFCGQKLCSSSTKNSLFCVYWDCLNIAKAPICNRYHWSRWNCHGVLTLFRDLSQADASWISANVLLLSFLKLFPSLEFAPAWLVYVVFSVPGSLIIVYGKFYLHTYYNTYFSQIKNQINASLHLAIIPQLLYPKELKKNNNTFSLLWMLTFSVLNWWYKYFLMICIYLTFKQKLTSLGKLKGCQSWCWLCTQPSQPPLHPGVPLFKWSHTIHYCPRLFYTHMCLYNLRSGGKINISQVKLPSAFIALRFSVKPLRFNYKNRHNDDFSLLYRKRIINRMKILSFYILFPMMS